MEFDPPTPRGPGQVRSHPPPTSTGKIPFTYAPTGLEGETAFFLWGDLSSTTKTPLVVLHGGPGFTHQYLKPLSLLHADHGIPVLMYDQIGCGASTRFPAKQGVGEFWAEEMFIAELENVVKHFGIKEYDLLGQSWGGMLAGQYATTQPKGIRKLIIEGGPHDLASYIRAGERYILQMPKEMQETLARCEKEGKWEGEDYKAAEMYFYTHHLCRVSPWPQELLDAFADVEADSTVYSAMMGPNEFCCTGTLKTWSVKEALHKITAETVPGGMLVMNGYYDPTDDEATDAFFYQPTCRVKWIKYGLSGHLPMLEETEKFLKDLGMFLTVE